MALPPTWVSIAIAEVEDSNDPHEIAKAVFNHHRVITAIRTGIVEFDEMTASNKEIEARNGGHPIVGAPTKAEVIRSKILEAVESMDF